MDPIRLEFHSLQALTYAKQFAALIRDEEPCLCFKQAKYGCIHQHTDNDTDQIKKPRHGHLTVQSTRITYTQIAIMDEFLLNESTMGQKWLIMEK